MKFDKLVLLTTCLFLTSCNTVNTTESTTTSNDSSTSFIENENEIKEVKRKANAPLPQNVTIQIIHL